MNKLGFHSANNKKEAPSGEVKSEKPVLSYEDLCAENQRLRLLVNTVPQVIYETNDKGFFTFANNTVFSMTGYTQQEVCNGMHALDLVCPESHDLLKKNITEVLNENYNSTTEYCLLKKNGEKLPVLVKSSVIKKQGRVIGLRGTITSISSIKKLQMKLKQSEERFRSIFIHTTVGMYRTTPNGHILLANPALLKMLGYKNFEELALRNLEGERYEPEYDRVTYKEAMEKYGFINRMESIWVKKNNEKVWIRESAVLIRDKEGQPLYYDGTVEDMTSYKKTEAALKQEQSLLKKSQELGAIGSWQLDFKTGKITASDELIKMYQLPKKENYFLDEFTSVIHPDDQHERNTKWEKAMQTGTYDSTYRLIVKEVVKWVRSLGELIYDKNNKPIGMIGAVQDISEQKAAELRLQDRSEEMAQFNEAMVGRELRIIELKEEVNKLCLRLGLSKAYPTVWDEEGPSTDDELK